MEVQHETLPLVGLVENNRQMVRQVDKRQTPEQYTL